MEVVIARPEGFDLDSYLGDAWSVYRGRSLHRVVLRFDPQLAPLLENPCHHEGEETISTTNARSIQMKIPYSTTKDARYRTPLSGQGATSARSPRGS